MSDVPPIAAPSLSSPDSTAATARWLGTLDAVSLAYILLPLSLYVFGWLHAFIAAPLLLLLFAGAWTCWQSARKDEVLKAERVDAAKWQMVAIGVLSLFVVACTGIGAFTFQFFDYIFYNAVLRDLIQYDWPLAYAEAGPDRTPQLLVIYAAYWLPAAMVGKIGGWIAAYYAHYLWAAMGLFLVAIWFLRIVGAWRLGLVLLLFFFGGMDIVGRMLSEGGPGHAQVGWWDYLTGVFWWSEGRGWLDHWSSGFALTDPELSNKAGGVFFRFYSPLSFFVDGPQHLVPGMVAMMMIIHDLWRRRTTERVLFLWSCLPLCSVFVAAGSVPFVLLGMVEVRARNLLTLANMAALPVAGILMLYFSSAVGGRVSGFIWEFADLPSISWYLALHYIVEFGLLAALLPVFRQPGGHPSVFWLLGALTMFVLAPFYRIGQYNDFASKIIISAQFVFMLYVAMAIVRAGSVSQRLRRVAVICIVAIGALAPLGIIARALDFGMFNAPPSYERVRHINDVEPRILALQGKGDPESPFWKYLARPPVYRPSELIYPSEQDLVWNFQELKVPLSYWIFFVPQEQYNMDSLGLHIRSKGNQPILRRDNLALDTDKVGMIEIDADVRVDGKVAEDVALVVVWANEEQVAEAEGKWPFQRWHANQAWPVRNIVSTNSYWRGTVSSIAFYLRAPKVDERAYEVTIRKISFLER